jgi:hypothetical protein
MRLPDAVLSARAGHSTVALTKSYYVHDKTSRDALRAEGEAMGALLNPNRTRRAS